MSKATETADPFGPLTADDALAEMLAMHEWHGARTLSPFGDWYCKCGTKVGGREGWLRHMSAGLALLWSPKPTGVPA